MKRDLSTGFAIPPHFLKKMYQLRFTLKMVSVVLLGFMLSGTTWAQGARDMKGYNWADRRDNFQVGRIEPSGLADTMTDTQVNSLADRVCHAFKNPGNGNTIRFGVNPATLSDTGYWTRYKKLIDRCITTHGMKIIIAYWEGQKDGVIDNYNLWRNMWLQLDSEYGNNSHVYMEPMNEPYGYNRNDLLNMYQDFRNFMTNLPDARTLCGGTGYSEDVAEIGGDSRVDGCLFSLHLYHWFGSQDNENGWKNRLDQKVGDYAHRTVVTEWGSECTQGANYNQSSSDNKVSYVRGMSQRIKELNMGSVYWPGVRDSGDWFRIFNSSSDLTVTNQSMMDRIHLAFDFTGIQDGIYNITNRNSGKCLTTLNGSPADATQVVQYTCNSSTNQQWDITEISSGVYNMVHVASGKYADIDGGSTVGGANNIIWPGNGGDNQQWHIVDQGSGYYHIINLKSRLYLDISGGSTANDANNIQWYANGGQNQDWALTLAGSSSARLASAVDTKKSLDTEVDGHSAMQVYPNPSPDGLVNIEVPGIFSHSSGSRLSIINLKGNVVYQGAISGEKDNIDLSGLPKGIYVLRFQNNDHFEFEKLVLE